MTDQPETPAVLAAAHSVPASSTQQPGEDVAASDASAKTKMGGFNLVLDVPLRVTVEIGSARMLVQEVLQLDVGSVIELDRMAGEPADMLINGRIVARGEVIVSDDQLSIRLVEITGGNPLGDRNR